MWLTPPTSRYGDFYSYLGTALCLCSGRFSAEARGTKMFSKAVLYPGLLLLVHQSLSWTVKAIYYHHTLTRATILRFFPTPRSVSCTRYLLCCSKLDLGHCRRLCERDNDIINGFQFVPGVSTPPTLLPLLQSCCCYLESSLCRFCAFATAKWVLSIILVYSRALLVNF